jgi:hypothetical protein
LEGADLAVDNKEGRMGIVSHLELLWMLPRKCWKLVLRSRSEYTATYMSHEMPVNVPKVPRNFACNSSIISCDI